MKKKWMLTLVCAVALLGLAGCASNADTIPSPSPMASASPSTAPMASPSMMPEATTLAPDMTPANSPDAQTTNLGVTTASEAKRVSSAVEDELEKLSEVDEAEVLVLGNVALVGVTFDSQYKGGMTTRVKDMVKDRIGTVQKGIETVAVTDDPTLVKAIDDLKESLEGSGSLTDLTGKVNTLVQQIMNPKATGTAKP